MPDILHDLPIQATCEQVFQALVMPECLDAWWTKRCKGEPEVGETYELFFTPQYDWRAVVSRCVPGEEFEWKITRAMPDWMGTRVGFRLEEKDGATWLRFRHTGWAEPSEHYRITSYCWATNLRLLKRYLEQGDSVPYEKRINA